jgi:hypothetical protein
MTHYVPAPERVHDIHEYGDLQLSNSPEHSQETVGDNWNPSGDSNNPLPLLSNSKASSVEGESTPSDSSKYYSPPRSDLSSYSAPSEKVFIYEEGKEDSLAKEISDYLDRADRSYDLEINISNCFEPSVTGNIFRTLRDEYDKVSQVFRQLLHRRIADYFHHRNACKTWWFVYFDLRLYQREDEQEGYRLRMF